MNRRFAIFPIMTSAELLTVNENDLAFGQLTNGGYPLEEASRKLFGI
jgi:hypothetical protein